MDVKIPYSEPYLRDLEIAEIIAGANLELAIDEVTFKDRYGQNIEIGDKLDLFRKGGGEVSYNLDSLTAQMGFYPEFRRAQDEKLFDLTISPPLNSLRLDGVYDFYNGDFYGDRAVLVPFGFFVGADKFAICGADGAGLAIGANNDEQIVNLGFGDNAGTYDWRNYEKQNPNDGFYVLIFNAALKHTQTLKLALAPYPNYKMSFYGGAIWLINYDLSARKLAFIRQGQIIYSDDLSSGESLKFIRTYKFDLVYSHKRFWLCNKQGRFVLRANFDMSAQKLNFNPVLCSIAIKNGSRYSVWRIYGRRINHIASAASLREYLMPFVAGWNGNIKYDYLLRDVMDDPQIKEYIKEAGYRGHYLKSIGEYAGDITAGKMSGSIELGYGFDDDFCLNNSDDGDLGIKSFLRNRRFLLPHALSNLTALSYARSWKGGERSIVFYSLNFNNNFGKLIKFDF